MWRKAGTEPLGLEGTLIVRGSTVQICLRAEARGWRLGGWETEE